MMNGEPQTHTVYCSPLIYGTNIDELVKSRKLPFSVIPAKAGIQ